MRISAVRRARRAAPVQQSLPFLRRLERRERLFKAAILAATATLAAGLLAGSPDGRLAVANVSARARRLARRPLGRGPSREEIDAEHARRRRLGMARTREVLARSLAREGPRYRRFMEAARMGPDSAVIRWGNYGQALVLSSAVFEPDDAGRSYRLRP